MYSHLRFCQVIVGGFLLVGCTSEPPKVDPPNVKDKAPQPAIAPVDKDKERPKAQPADAEPGAVNSFDATWKVRSVEFRSGKREFSYEISNIKMAITDGAGLWWEDDHIVGTITVDLSEFKRFHKGFPSAPFQLGYTKGPRKGQTWQGICSRCGGAAIVCFSFKDRPQNYDGNDVEPVIAFSFRQHYE